MNLLTPDTCKQWEVSGMYIVLDFFLGVAASVVAYYLCKWIDTQQKKGK